MPGFSLLLLLSSIVCTVDGLFFLHFLLPVIECHTRPNVFTLPMKSYLRYNQLFGPP